MLRLAILSLAAALAAAADGPEQVRLQLNYAHQFQFAGYYEAVARGYYRDEGLAVRVDELTPRTSQLEDLFAKRYEFAIYGPTIVRDWGEGRDLFLVAVVQQRCPSAIFVRTDSKLGSLAELLKLPREHIVGPASNGYLDLEIMLHGMGTSIGAAFPRPKDAGDFERFINGDLEALPGYTTNEPARLHERGIAVRQLALGPDTMRSFGDALVCRGDTWREHPAMVERFRRASLRGWERAITNPEEAIDVILADYPSAWQPVSREHLRREAAAITDSIAADLIAVGTIDRPRLEGLARRLHDAGMPAAVPPERFWGGVDPDARWFPALIWGLGIALAASAALALAVWFLRRARLRTDEVFRALMDAADGFVLFHCAAGPDGRLRPTRASTSLAAVTGLSLRQLQEDPGLVLERLSEDDRQGHLDAVARAIGSRSPLRRRIRLLHPGHREPRHLLLIATPIPGRAPEYVGACIDLTAEAEAEQALRDAQRRLEAAKRSESLGLLASGVAHDFNNLLGAIRGNAEMAVAKLADDDSAKHRVARVLEAADRAAGLVRQILAYAGKGTIEQRPIDLAEELRVLRDLLRHSIAKNVAIELACEPDIPRVMFDPAQLQQVLVNLIVNAAESYEGRDGAVKVALRRGDKGTVVVEVADQGCGMDAATQARMFEPYFTTKRQGHGLGLAAVQGIVRASGATLACRSAKGTGTTFTVAFPVGSVPARPTTRFESPLPEPGRTLLVADDDELMREMAVSMAKELGYTVFSASDGEEAMRLLDDASTRWSGAVLDCVMPDRGGPELVRELRARGSRLPVLLVSGMVDAGRIGTGILDRRTRFLAKPFSKALFERTLQTLLRPGNPRDDSGAFADLQRESSVHQVLRPRLDPPGDGGKT